MSCHLVDSLGHLVFLFSNARARQVLWERSRRSRSMNISVLRWNFCFFIRVVCHPVCRLYWKTKASVRKVSLDMNIYSIYCIFIFSKEKKKSLHQYPLPVPLSSCSSHFRRALPSGIKGIHSGSLFFCCCVLLFFGIFSFHLVFFVSFRYFSLVLCCTGTKCRQQIIAATRAYVDFSGVAHRNSYFARCQQTGSSFMWTPSENQINEYLWQKQIKQTDVK